LNTTQIPYLTTTHHTSLQPLEQCLLDAQTKIEGWFRQQFQMTSPPIYASVDLRNAEFKIAPVDTNLFPAGFNNLNPDMFSLAIQAWQTSIESQMPGCTNILIIPENHTRNRFYFENLYTLQMLIRKAGFNVKIGSLLQEISEPKSITLTNKEQILLTPITRVNNRLLVDDFNPCLILLNNDLSTEVPDILKNLDQPIAPPLQMGWNRRTKTHHFEHYKKVSEEFATLIGFDPWLITPLFTYCTPVNFTNGEGEDCLIKKSYELLTQIEKKYQQYQIQKKPFITIKADTGTYGIGVMMLDDPETLKHLSRKMRKEMATTKGGKKLDRVIIQEGVYTHETWGEEKFSAEPVVYMVGKHVIGGFYRIHPERGQNQNLNSPGMQFIPLAFTEPCNTPDYHLSARECPNRFYAYGVIARLALVAAAREMQEHLKEDIL
jgi:glutamate--cysteine ligase